jgi:uncharacterized protein (TIGR03437 family)
MGAGLGSGDLDHVRVEVNGEIVPVMVASPSQVTFQCPDLAPGTPLDITVRTDVQVSNARRLEMEELGPGLFTIDGLERARGAILLNDTSELAINAADVNGRASRPGDTISILCTGLGRTFGPGEGEISTLPMITIGGLSTPVLSVTRVERGLYQVNVRIPEAAPLGDAIPVEVRMPAINGRLVGSNQAYISVERGSRAE